MNANGRPTEPIDLRTFHQNWRKCPPEELWVYAGQYVAWSPDGKRIVAGAESRRMLYQKLEELGIHFSQVVFDYIDPPDMAVL